MVHSQQTVNELAGFNLELNGDAWDSCAIANGNPATGIASAAYKKQDGTFSKYEDGCSADSCDGVDRLTATEEVLNGLVSSITTDKATFVDTEELVDFADIAIEGSITFGKKDSNSVVHHFHGGLPTC